MTRLWGGTPTAVVIIAIGGDGAPLRRVWAEIANDQPLTIALPADTRRVMLQATTEDPRIRVELAQHRPSRASAGRPGRPGWLGDPALRWRWFRADRDARRWSRRQSKLGRKRGGAAT